MADTERNDSDQMKEWLGLLDDKERAEVLKVQIAEKEQTERVRLEQQGQTDRDDDVVSGRYIVRGIWAVVAFAAICCGTCMGYNHIEKKAATEQARIEAEHRAPPPPQPSASASAK